jgi:hypothetical protein
LDVVYHQAVNVQVIKIQNHCFIDVFLECFDHYQENIDGALLIPNDITIYANGPNSETSFFSPSLILQ